MKLWIVSLFDPTINDKTRPMRFTNLSLAALNGKCNTTVFSNTFRHSTKEFRFEKHTEIIKNDYFKTIYIDSISYKKNISPRRFISHLIYTINFYKCIRKFKDKPNTVVSALPPIWINVFLAFWCKKNSIKFIVDIIDPWPDVFYKYWPEQLWPLKWVLRLLIFPQKIALKYILNNATKIASISNEYIKWAQNMVQNINIKGQVFYPSVDIKQYKQVIINRSKVNNNISNKINLIYAGNLGFTYDIPCILNTAKKLHRDYPNRFHVRFAGTGYYQDLIEKESKQYECIEYLGRLEHAELLKAYSLSHLGLAQYHVSATQSITYKFFDYLAAGLPILNSLQSEMAVLIDENNLGMNNPSGNSDILAQNIISFLDNEKLQEYSLNAQVFAEMHGNNDSVYKEYLSYLTTTENA